MRFPEISIEVHEWEDGAQTIITRNGHGARVHIANYSSDHVLSNQTVCVHDVRRRLIGYVKYHGNGEVDHFAAYEYEGANTHESFMTMFDKDKRPLYNKKYRLSETGRPTRADYVSPDGRLLSYEEYVYEQERCVTVRHFDADGKPIEHPITE